MAKSSPAKLRPNSYFNVSHQPLPALFFLLPLIVLYELGTISMAAQGDGKHMEVNRAYSLLSQFLGVFGVTGYYLPGLIVVVVLVCWHVARRDKWRFEPGLYAMMWVEAILLALPLLVAGLIYFRSPEGNAMATAGPALAAVSGLARLRNDIVQSVGAGIYEELLFRLIAIALLHMVFCDLLALPNSWGATASVVISAVAFSYYHFDDLNMARWSGREWNLFLFRACAGVYLAIIYVLRGFGIVAGTHAVYDIILAVLGLTATHGP